MKRILATLVTATALSASMVASAVAQQPIKIAALYNLTGGMSSLDAPSLNGAKLKAQEINDAGGLLDGRKLTLAPIDTKTDLQNASTAAKRATGMSGVVAGIGYSDTSYVLSAGPVFQRAGIPFLTSGATLPRLPQMVGDELFLAPFGDNVQASAMAEYAYNELDIKKVAVWTDQGMDYTKALSKYFRQRFKALGGTIALKSAYQTGDRDFSAQVSRLQTMTDQVDAVFTSSGPNEAGPIVKQIRQSGIEMPILGGDGLDTPLVVSVPGKELANNVYFTTHAILGEQAEAFRNAYKAAYGNPPENAFAALSYDAVGLLADAIKRAGKAEPEAITQALSNTQQYDGITGTISYAEGNVPSKPVAIMKVENGEVNRQTVVTPSKIATSSSSGS